MPETLDFILGEFRRTIDERYRISIPTELSETLTGQGTECILAKERPGCLSLWNELSWGERLNSGVSVIQNKMHAGRLDGRMEDVQLLGRLLSTRHKTVQITGRARLLIPEGFREFLAVEAGGDVVVVGAALCVEIWNPNDWISYLREQMPDFVSLLNRLAD